MWNNCHHLFHNSTPKPWITVPMDGLKTLISIVSACCIYRTLLRRLICCIPPQNPTSDALAESPYYAVTLRRTTHTDPATVDRDSFIRSSIRCLAPSVLTDVPPVLTELHASINVNIMCFICLQGKFGIQMQFEWVSSFGTHTLRILTKFCMKR